MIAKKNDNTPKWIIYLSGWWEDLSDFSKRMTSLITIFTMLSPFLYRVTNSLNQIQEDRIKAQMFRDSTSIWQRESTAKINSVIRSLTIDKQEHQIVFEELGLPYWRSDSTGGTVYASDYLVKMTGLPAERSMGTLWINNVRDDYKQRVREDIRITVAEHTDWYSVFPFNIHGQYLWVESKGKKVVDVFDGHITNYVGIIKPLKNQKEPSIYQGQ